VLAYFGMLPVSLRKHNRINIESDLRKQKATTRPAVAKEYFHDLIHSDRAGGRRDMIDEARLAQEAMLAKIQSGEYAHAALFETPPGLVTTDTERDEAYIAFGMRSSGRQDNGNRRTSESIPVSKMSKEERISRLQEMDPCTVCKKKHFGPNGPGRCAADKSVPLPPMFKQKTTPARYAYVMALRRGENAMATEEEEPCYDDLDDIEQASSAAETTGPKNDLPEPKEEALQSFETQPDADIDPYEAMRRDMHGAAHLATDDLTLPTEPKHGKSILKSCAIAAIFALTAVCFAMVPTFTTSTTSAPRASPAMDNEFAHMATPMGSNWSLTDEFDDAGFESIHATADIQTGIQWEHLPGTLVDPAMIDTERVRGRVLRSTQTSPGDPSPHEQHRLSRVGYGARSGRPQEQVVRPMGLASGPPRDDCREVRSPSGPSFSSGTGLSPRDSSEAVGREINAPMTPVELETLPLHGVLGQTGSASGHGPHADGRATNAHPELPAEAPPILPRLPGAQEWDAACRAALACATAIVGAWIVVARHIDLTRTWRRRVTRLAPLLAILALGVSRSTAPTEDEALSRMVKPIQLLGNVHPIPMRAHACAFNASSPGSGAHGHSAVIDSGASSVALIEKGFFDHLVPLHGRYMKIANGDLVPIEGIGPATMLITDAQDKQHKVSIKRALYVPKFAGNLLSVGSLWENDGIDVVFRDTNALLMPGWRGAKIPFSRRPYTVTIAPIGALSQEAACLSGGPNDAEVEVADSRGNSSANTHGPLESRFKATQGKHSSKDKSKNAEIVHSRLMHCGEDALRSVARTCEGMERLAGAVLKACPVCLRANARTQPTRGAVPAPNEFGWVSFDIAGPFIPTLHYRHKYLMVFRDLHTGLHWGYLLRSRDQAPHTILQFLADSATNGTVKRLHSDNEFRSEAIEAITLARGIKHTFVAPHEPRQNASSERQFGLIFEKVRAALAQGGVPRSMWGDAALQAIEVINRTRVVRDGLTAWQVAYKKKARIDHLRPMFCRAWLKIPPPDLPRSAKVYDRGVECLHVGSDGPSYRL